MPKKAAGILVMSSLILAVLLYLIHSIFSFQKIPDKITIDRIVVYKSKHELQAWSNGQLIVTYRVAIGRNPVGDKEFEGDYKTPEGFYTINDKNPNSAWHKNLGISYPNKQDIAEAKRLGKSAGGNIKIHGLKNGSTNIGKLHCLQDWTFGCIALTNEEVDELYEHTPIGIPIEIRK